MRTTPIHFKEGPRRLEVRWLEPSWGMTGVRVTVRMAATPPECAKSPLRPPAWMVGRALRGRRGGQRSARPTFSLPPKVDRLRWKFSRPSGFTVLEMLVVVTIIGFLAAMAIPHLTGMTSANSMNLATQQMLSDVGLARQLAISHRTTVYMVFASPSLAALSQPNNEVTAYTNVLSHQYSAYALVSLSSVGDQPGAHYPQYLTPWKTLPQGVFIPTYKFTATSPTLVVTTNTLSGTTNGFPIRVFTNITPVTSVANIVTFPFPAVDTVTAANVPLMVALPYVGFTSSGQLTSLSSGLDEYIPLARGSVFNFPNGAQANELPTGNSINNATIIHIDALTGRAKIERNQF